MSAGEWEFQAPMPGLVGQEQRALGPCWFFCGHRIAPVVWIGWLTSAGVAAPLYACDGCLGQLHAMAWDFSEASRDAPVDGTGRLVPLYRPLGAGGPPEPLRYRCRDPLPRTPFGGRLAQLVTAEPWPRPTNRPTEQGRSTR
ncbi:hypothetical protein [Streptomyces profundus]|uniref:hypothetical protein n=1 Tax=Streptomyces profundus TaxID=2867410 RepID=UPI001D16CB2D|nr:hypothetical protein [Streptomyces sp. MA3_2.13]UED84171.1 hypothetical protein K4G22_08070 [Streptomyces sp. MA3_2.13]